MTTIKMAVVALLMAGTAFAGGKGYNTGITGGIKGINNKVPRPRASKGHNTGITGGIKGINNKVPASAIVY